MAESREAEIVANYEYFATIVAAEMALHAGEYALLRKRKVVDYFRTAAEAVSEGARQFGELPFSVQHVINRPIDLGFLSHASDNGITVRR